MLDFKKQERAKELAALESELAAKQGELSEVQHRLESADAAGEEIDRIEYKLSRDEDYAVPEPSKLMSAKNYRERFVVPLVQRLKDLVRAVLVTCVKAWDKIALLRGENEELENENRRLEERLASLEEKNDNLHKQSRDYALLRRVFGDDYVDGLVAEAREKQQKANEQNKNRKETQHDIH